MPSKSFSAFEHNVVDVNRLLASHKALNGTGQGRRGLGHITRSGVVMLCAAWEMYIEQVLIEGLRHLVEKVSSPEHLPKTVQKTLSSYVHNHKHELKPLHLAGDGWKVVLIECATSKTDMLNTPKSGNIKELYSSLLGILDVTSIWTQGATYIDTFVTIRGNIAHCGRQAGYIKVNSLTQYKEVIRLSACETDNAISEHIRTLGILNKKPWNTVT